jgi:hypothetical protein
MRVTKLLYKPLSVLVLTSLAIGAQALIYVPLDPGSPRSGAASMAWKLDHEIADGTALGPTETRHSFHYYSFELAVKLGISYVDVTGGSNHSFLVAESSRGRTFDASLKINGSAEARVFKALVGTACRVSMLVQGKDLGLAVTGGGVGAEAKLKTVEETLSFLALGFTTYQAFTIDMDTSGQVNLGLVRKKLMDVFNAFNVAQDNLEDSRPQVLGVFLPDDVAKKLKATDSVEITVHNPRP